MNRRKGILHITIIYILILQYILFFSFRLHTTLQGEHDAVLSSETDQSDELIDSSIEAHSAYTVCVIIDREETTLAWKLMSQSKVDVTVTLRLCIRADEH